MKLSNRFLTVGVASVIGMAVLAPTASADRGNRDLTIGLGAASIALLATHNTNAGLIGLGLTALSASDHGRAQYCAPDPRFDRDRDHRDIRQDNRRDDQRGDQRDSRGDHRR